MALALLLLPPFAAATAWAANRQDDAPAAPEVASDTAQDLSEVFMDVVDVRVVNIDVYVTDKSGERITGLTRDDFELFEDGRPMPISNFYAVEDGRPAAEAIATVAGSPAERDGVESAGPVSPEPEPVPAEQRLHLIVYVDNFNIRPENRNRVLDELGFFVNTRLRRDDRAMLVSYDRSLKVRQPFTSDPALVARAMDELKRVTGAGISRDDERRDAFEHISDARGASSAYSWAHNYAESMQNNLQFTLGGLKEMIDDLAGLPGRKAIVYVSDGLPMVPGQEAFLALDAKFGNGGGSYLSDAFTYDASRRFTELANAANANRITFYTVDAAGLRVYSSFTANNASPSPGVGVDSALNMNLQSPLRLIADATGGTAIVNTNRTLPMLERVAEDFDTYYSLGFNPAHAGGGRYHKLRVEVRGRRGLVVRHREGYRDKSIEAQMTDGTVSALHFAFEDNPLGLGLSFGTASLREDRRTYLVPVDLDIPLDRVALVPRAGSYVARLRLFVAALDERGDSSAVQQVAVPIDIPAGEMEEARGKHFRYSVPLLMRPGGHRVAVGVRDELGSEESYVVESVVVGSG